MYEQDVEQHRQKERLILLTSCLGNVMKVALAMYFIHI